MRPLEQLIVNPEGKHVALKLPIAGTSQCVGFARRWLERKLDLTFAEVHSAADIWQQVTTYKHCSDGTVFYTVNRDNGHTQAPQFGDLIIYNRCLDGNGHVAVVTAINQRQSTISVAEQNFMNRYQAPGTQRQIPYLLTRNRFQLLQAHIIGWKHVCTSNHT